MDKAIVVNPKRILWCSEERGFDVPELARKAGISEGTLERVFTKGAGLSFNQLQSLAKLFNRGVLFFVEPGEPEETRLYSPQFRTLANQKPTISPKVRALIQRVERQRDILLGLREELGASPAVFEPPALPTTSIEDAAEEVRAWLGLEDRNTFDSYRRAIEAKGILVIRTNGYNGPWQLPKDDPTEGFCLYDAICPVIVVKKQYAETRQTFTLFHELGHLLLHRRSFVDDRAELVAETGEEREANEFAGHVLMPRRFLRLVDLTRMPAEAGQYDEWLRAVRGAWGVSGEAILIQLQKGGFIARDDVAAYQQWLQARAREESAAAPRAYRYREPLNVFGETFARTVVEALSRNRISSNKASIYLDNLKLKDLRQLEAYLATH